MTDRFLRARSFGQVAETYARLRAAPPAAALVWLLGGRRCGTALEIGAGTGLATLELAKLASRVYAVEPSEAMRAAFVAGGSNVSLLNGQAERLPVPTRSVDVALAFDAWHWFEPVPTVREVARVLRPGGWLGASWNQPDTSCAWSRELWAVVTASHASERQPGQFRLPEDAPFGTAEQHVLYWHRLLSVAEVVGLLGTYSAVVNMTGPRRARYLAHQHNFLVRHAPVNAQGVLALPIRTVCWRTQRATPTTEAS